MIKKILFISSLLWIGLSFIPLQRDSQELQEIIGNENVHAILKRACLDCHSYQTQWPWYSYIFPTNILIYNHVKEGREELNFHNWNTLEISKQQEKIEDILEQVEEEEMPLKSYLLIHREAQISENDLNILRNWQKEVNTKVQELENIQE